MAEAGEPDPAQALAAYSGALAEGIAAALPAWVLSSVGRVMTAWAGRMPAEVAEEARAAAARASVDVAPAVERLLSSDVDDQSSTPLALVRSAVRYPTEVLRAAGVPPVERDGFAEAAFPDDIYDLTPASFADIDPALAEVALRWGAAKAFEHKRRHR